MKKSGIARYLGNLRLSFFGYVIVIAVGLWAWFTLPREEMPAIKLPVTLVSVVLPGANPQDVEQLITVPLEDKLRGIKGIDYIRSSSMENASVSIIMFKEDFNTETMVQKVREKVDATNLPSDALEPTIMQMDFDEVPVWTFALTGSDRVGLTHVAEKLEEELERQATIDRVEITGVQDREIVVHMDQADIAKYGVNPAALATNIAAATANVPAGSVNLGNYSYSVSIDKEVADIDQLRRMAIILNGVEYQLGDIAHIYEQEKPGNTNSYQLSSDGQVSQVVTLNVYKTAGSDIDANAELAHQVVDRVLLDYPQYNITSLSDTGEEIKDTFNDLYKNIIETIALVFLIMFIFLGAREATIAAVSIPVVMLVTFGGMMAAGLSLNFVSLFGLLIALGMLVDNAIVVVTALSRSYFERRDQGVTALQAGVDVWNEFFVALISTNLTTIWAFLPLLLVTGIMGQMVFPVGIVVTVAMLASALVAFLLTLPLGIYVLEPRVPVRLQKFIAVAIVLVVTIALIVALPKNWLLIPIILVSWLLLFALLAWRLKSRHQRQQQSTANSRGKILTVIQDGLISTAKIENAYQNVIGAILAKRSRMWISIIVIFVITIASFSLPLIGLVHSEFFPKEEADYFDMILTLPVGTNIDQTDRVARELLPQLAENVPDLNYITAQVGRGSGSSIASAGSNDNKVVFTFNLIPEKQRHSSSIATAAQVRERWQDNPYGQIEVNEMSSVSSGGGDIQLYLIGEDMDVLSEKAGAMVDWLKAQPGVVDVKSDIDNTSKRLVFRPDDQLITSYGLSNSSLGLWLRSSLSGWNLGSLRKNKKDVDITLRQHDSTPKMETLSNIQVPISEVGYVPLESLGQITIEPNLAQISRRDYNRAVEVSASVENGYSSTEINAQFEQFIQNELNLPAGYKTTLGGVQDMNNNAIRDLALAMVIAFMLILITLVIQLRSFRKAFIVMSVIPVAISGVFINFAILGWSLSLPAVIGVLALFGIVVNNSILIIERINQNLDAGQDFMPAVIEGSVSRLQPILLTSLTTIIGMLPITLSSPLWQGLGGAIVCGLTFSGVLLLFYVPSLFVIMFEPKFRRSSDDQWRALLDKLSS
ncbi:efflux RND transporter permease subunit [bacterium]|nr:efflux RND transporter permease subunit [bacterium]